MSDVNYISQLNGVLRKFADDENISSSHRSLYLAFFEIWNQKRFPKTIRINSKQVMVLAKIRSRTTYHKLLRNLIEWEYLQYRPTSSPHMGSLIELFRFDTPSDQKLNKSCPVTEQLPVQKTVPFNKRDKHNINLLQTCCPKNEQIVISYFEEKRRSSKEAKKFYNFYESIGWKLNGHPITNWKACAQNWMLKADEIKKDQELNSPAKYKSHLHTKKDKDYGQPL